MTHSKANNVAGFRNAEKDQLRKDSHSVENTKGIENHIKAAEHFSLASNYHYEAARYHEEGNHEKANQSTLLAIGHSSMANEYQIQDAHQHALES
jgi:hypothetical protein